MSTYSEDRTFPLDGDAERIPEAVVIDVEAQPVAEGPPMAQIVRRRARLPALLFVATCLTTLWAGASWEWWWSEWTGAFWHALKYAVPVMTILLCHEMGHFLQARRYGVFASYPYFLPVPFGPLGTFGAVIGMEARRGDRKALFDIGISGPLAGLVPTLIFCYIGLQWSRYVPGRDMYGDPLLFKWLAMSIHGPIPPGEVIKVHPMAFAGWVGLLITSLNLMPIGQLDGGHILYGLLRQKAHLVAQTLLLAAIMIVVWNYEQFFGWTLMLFLLAMMGPNHPPTANDYVELGPVRTLLGWLTLAFIPIGFTPQPFIPP